MRRSGRGVGRRGAALIPHFAYASTITSVRSSSNGATVTVCFDSPIAYVPPTSWAIPSRAGVAAGSPGSGDATTTDADGAAVGAGALPTAAGL
jgi:hypothetical protein